MNWAKSLPFIFVSVCVCVPISRAMRKSLLRCSSFKNSWFCRKRAILSSSKYCFNFLSCSDDQTLPDRAPLLDESCVRDDREEEEEEEGCDKLLWERCGRTKITKDIFYRNGIKKINHEMIDLLCLALKLVNLDFNGGLRIKM